MTQDWNPLEQVNNLDEGKVWNNPQYLVELCRNLLKEHRSHTQDHLPPPLNLPVEQAVVCSTLPQEYSTLTFRGEVVAGGGGVEERSEVIY